MTRARCSLLSGRLARAEHSMFQGLTVLMYHRVLPDQLVTDAPLASLVMPLSAFRAQVDWMAAHLDVVPLRDAIGRLHGSTPAENPLASITFDDGFADNHEYAAPELDARGLRATFFITTDPIGTDRRLWFDEAATLWRTTAQAALSEVCRDVIGKTPPVDFAEVSGWMQFLKDQAPATRGALLERLRKNESFRADEQHRMMTWGEIKSLADRGHEVGAHSRHHPLLPQLADAELVEEIAGSKADVENRLGTPCDGFCYPNGTVDDRVEIAVRTAGFRYGCVTARGRFMASSNPFRIARIDMNPRRLLDPWGRNDPVLLRRELAAV